MLVQQASDTATDGVLTALGVGFALGVIFTGMALTLALYLGVRDVGDALEREREPLQ